MKIDTHAHIIPKTWTDLEKKYGYGGFIRMDHFTNGKARMIFDDGRFFREVGENSWDTAAILRDMDKYEVDVMVLCPVPVLFHYWTKPKDGTDWCRFQNDFIAEVQHKYPKRFVGLGILPMQDLELSITELKRCRKDLRLYGVEIGSHIENKNLDDKYFFPLYEALQGLGAALFVHPWDMMGKNNMPNYFLPWLVGMPAETARALCSMIFGGIFDRFPALRVMFAHAGGSFPFTIGRIAHGYVARPDLCNVNNVKNPRDYLGKFWVDSITHDEALLRYLIRICGSDKICYGTDYPFPLGDTEHGSMIEGMDDLSVDIKEDIFQNSAVTWLNLDLKKFS